MAKDLAKAIELYTASADQGYERARLNLNALLEAHPELKKTAGSFSSPISQPGDTKAPAPNAAPISNDTNASTVTSVSFSGNGYNS